MAQDSRASVDLGRQLLQKAGIKQTIKKTVLRPVEDAKLSLAINMCGGTDLASSILKLCIG
jgi:hypothetical protein